MAFSFSQTAFTESGSSVLISFLNTRRSTSREDMTSMIGGVTDAVGDIVAKNVLLLAKEYDVIDPGLF